MKHYLKVYAQFIQTSLGQATSFRLHFFLLILVDLFFYLTTLYSVDMIYGYVETIGGWNREQLLFFTAVMLGIDQWHMALISENFWLLPQAIRTGSLDFTLLKPVSSMFISFFRIMRPASCLNLFIIWPIIIHFALKVGLEGWQFLLLPFLMFLGFILLVQIEIVISCSMFWVMEGFGINFLRMEFQRLARWPDFIYKRYARFLFYYLIPVLLIGNAPVRFLLNPHDYLPMVGLIVANGFFYLILKYFWPFALRHYESASS